MLAKNDDVKLQTALKINTTQKDWLGNCKLNATHRHVNNTAIRQEEANKPSKQGCFSDFIIKYEAQLDRIAHTIILKKNIIDSFKKIN